MNRVVNGEKRRIIRNGFGERNYGPKGDRVMRRILKSFFQNPSSIKRGPNPIQRKKRKK
jgi:hypothetical protein